jgi:hypothetical protein
MNPTDVYLSLVKHSIGNKVDSTSKHKLKYLHHDNVFFPQFSNVASLVIRKTILTTKIKTQVEIH